MRSIHCICILWWTEATFILLQVWTIIFCTFSSNTFANHHLTLDTIATKGVTTGNLSFNLRYHCLKKALQRANHHSTSDTIATKMCYKGQIIQLQMPLSQKGVTTGKSSFNFRYHATKRCYNWQIIIQLQITLPQKCVVTRKSFKFRYHCHKKGVTTGKSSFNFRYHCH